MRKIILTLSRAPGDYNLTFVNCVFNSLSIFIYNSDLSNFLLESGLSHF